MPKQYFRKGTKCEGKEIFLRNKRIVKLEHILERGNSNIYLEVSLLSGGGNEKKREEGRR